MEWWQTFFDKNFSTIGIEGRNDRAKKEVDFILKVLRVPKSALTLDLACGIGRHSIELAKRGYNVVGTDFNKEYIEHCKERAKELSLDNVRFMQMDMRKLNFKNKFDFIINIWTSFGYFSEEENLDTLRRMSKALKKNGKLLIDVANRDFLIKHFDKRSLAKFKGGYMLEEREFDYSKSVFNSRFTYFSKNKKKIGSKMTYSRVYSYHELKNMFESVGLKVVGSFGSFKGERVSFDNKRLILIGQKLK
jgi:ubiquinone/menaquinone biosynthesis C-methylase UbiE